MGLLSLLVLGERGILDEDLRIFRERRRQGADGRIEVLTFFALFCRHPGSRRNGRWKGTREGGRRKDWGQEGQFQEKVTRFCRARQECSRRHGSPSTRRGYRTRPRPRVVLVRECPVQYGRHATWKVEGHHQAPRRRTFEACEREISGLEGEERAEDALEPLRCALPVLVWPRVSPFLPPLLSLSLSLLPLAPSLW